jgi:hypothetical protein
MIFKLKRRTRTKKHKEWFDSTKQYRITFSKCVQGVDVTPHYYALIHLKLHNRTMWDFVAKHGPYRTFKAATEACDKHQRLWEKALQAENKRELLAVLGQLPVGIPEWIAGSMTPRLVHLLMEAAK